MSLLAGSWDGVESPEFLPGSGIERRDEPADTKVTTCRSSDDLVLDDERRHRECVSGLWTSARHGHVPTLASTSGIERDETTIDRPHEQRLTQDRQTAIHATAARTSL